MNDYSRYEKRRSRIIVVCSIVLTLLAVGVSFWFAGPPPPRQITLATGVPGGAYDAFGQQYKARLEKMGLKVHLTNSNGGIENLQLLKTKKVDAAFTQGGLANRNAADQSELRGIAALYLEPLWVFSRSSATIARLSDAKTRTVCVGPANSGTEAVAKALLAAHGVTVTNSKLINATPAEAEVLLIKGECDAALMVSSPQAAVIQRLLRQDGIALMDFASQDMAHTRRFPFLRPVKLYAGSIDLEKNVPATDKTLLAPAALLAARESLHPQVVEQLQEVMISLHSEGDLLSAPKTFPTLEGLDLPVHETAEAYANSGSSVLNRLLPYWAVRWIWRLQVLVLPLLAVGLPAMKFLPKIYGFWGMRMVKRCYRKLRDLESHVDRAQSQDELRAALNKIDALRQNMWAKTHRMPAIMQPDIYQWRTHVDEVHARAERRLREMAGDFV